MSAVEELKNILQNIIHEPTQFPEDGNLAFLTVGRVGRLKHPGALDFGGSEYAETEIEWLEPEPQAEDDKYGWWNLEPGTYQVEFNEGISLSENSGVLLQIWAQALKAGVTHPTAVITDSVNPFSTLLHVGNAGVGIKENARLSEVRLI